jgi:hypothetical protein
MRGRMRGMKSPLTKLAIAIAFLGVTVQPPPTGLSDSDEIGEF